MSTTYAKQFGGIFGGGGGGGGGGVTSLNTETGDLTITAGTNVAITTPTSTTIQVGVTSGNLTDAGTDGITVTGGTGAVLGSGTSIAQQKADSTHNGYLSSGDWSTFNGKQAALTIGNLTDAGTDGITVTGGTGAVIGSGTSIAQHVADATHNGYLSSTDWSTFNAKGSGTVTAVSVASANGFAGSSSGGATPALTLSTSITGVLKGNGTAISAAASGTDYAPATSGSSILYGNGAGGFSNVTVGSGLTFSAGSLTASAAAYTAPTRQSLTSTGTITGYVFTVTSASATVGATYTNNAHTFTVLATISGATTLFTSGASAPAASGTLTKATGTGDSTITFSSAIALATYTTPASVLYLKIRMVGGGGGGSSTNGTAASNAGSDGGATYFGTNILIATGGRGAGQFGTPLGAGAGTVNSPASGYGLTGGTGTVGTFVNSGTGLSWYNTGGAGGVSPFGGGGGGNVNGAGTNAAANTGAGGGGAGTTLQNTNNGGAGGSAGGFVDAFIASPAGTYYYAVGTGGAGGSATNSGFVGGNGGTGIIAVEEYYQ